MQRAVVIRSLKWIWTTNCKPDARIHLNDAGSWWNYGQPIIQRIPFIQSDAQFRFHR